MPVGGRDHRLAGTETISQRARGDLRLVEIRGQIDVGGTYEFAEFRIFHIPVHEHHIPLHSEVASELLERLAVALTIATDQIRMGGAEDDINDIRMLAGNLRKCPQGILDTLAGREEAEGQKHRTPGHAEVVFVKIRIRKGNVGNAVGDDSDFVLRDTMNIAEHFRTVVCHHHKFVGTFNQV